MVSWRGMLHPPAAPVHPGARFDTAMMPMPPFRTGFPTDMPTDPALVLFQRDDCHLCDLALAVLAEARAPAFESVFIDDDTALEAEYGHRVPVLRDTRRGIELDWPFDADAVVALRTLAG